MPKLVHADPKLCPFKNGRQSVVYLPDPPNSRPLRKIIRQPFGSQEAKIAYHMIIAEWRTNGCRASAIPVARDPTSSPMSLAELFAEVWKHASTSWVKNGKSSTKLNRLGYAIQRLRGFDDLPSESLGLKQIQAVANGIAAEGRGEDTFKKRLASIIDLVSVATSLGHLSTETRTRVVDACAAVRALPPDGLMKSTEVNAVDDDVVHATLPFLPPNARDAIIVARLCGARSGEMVTLRRREILTKVVGEKTVWYFTRDEDHKTAHQGHTMTRYFNDDAQKILQSYMDRRSDEDLIFLRSEDETWRKDKRKRVTPAHHGNRPGYVPASRAERKPRVCEDAYTSRSLYKTVERACKAAGIERWHPHQLRHSAAAQFGLIYGEEVGMKLLSQKSVTIFKRYAQKKQTNNDIALHAIACVPYTPKEFTINGPVFDSARD